MGPFLGTPFAALMSNISGLFGLDRRVANGRRQASSGCSVLDPRLEKGDRPAKGAATLQLVLTLDPQVQGEWHALCSPSWASKIGNSPSKYSVMGQSKPTSLPVWPSPTLPGLGEVPNVHGPAHMFMPGGREEVRGNISYVESSPDPGPGPLT
ncbi:hypothetical protein VTG60DRAFT_4101 [Thermothelomyces hinnuleus]